jgi:hypothetical protein
MAFVENNYYHLEELGGSDFEIVGDEPNIIGWPVKDDHGVKIGKVRNLLFDRQSRKVRYLVLDLDGNKFDLDEDRKVLIPIGIAELYHKGGERRERRRNEDDSYSENEHRERRHDGRRNYHPEDDGDVVLLPGVSFEHLNALPLYEKDHLSPHIEKAIRSIFRPEKASNTVEYDKDDFYKDEQFDDDRFYNHRKRDRRD